MKEVEDKQSTPRVQGSKAKKENLEKKLEDLCVKLKFKYRDMGLIESASGDLHSNASISLKVIQLSSSLLKHHKG